jgi:hypothetical protein
MPRLLTLDLLATAIQWTGGPGAKGSGRATFLGGAEQTSSRLGDLLALRADLSRKQGPLARREGGILRALAIGENAARVRLPNLHLRTFAEAGGSGDTVTPWSNGQRWSNGFSWEVGRPIVDVDHVGATVGTYRIRLADQHWGHLLSYGDVIGFWPSYFGAHWIVGVEEDGSYIISPPLRANLGGASRATLEPVLVMSAVPESITLQDGLISTDGQSVELVEILHEDVLAYFNGAWI